MSPQLATVPTTHRASVKCHRFEHMPRDSVGGHILCAAVLILGASDPEGDRSEIVPSANQQAHGVESKAIGVKSLSKAK